MTQEQVSETIALAVELAKDWPAWKKNIINYSLSPTRNVPREAVDNTGDDA